MWVFLNNSFLLVENRNNKDELLVRSRIKGDIEKSQMFLKWKILSFFYKKD